MVDLSTDYLGLKLKNPIIVGSSGLTSSVKKIKGLEENGAGAVVLKCIFEEEIAYEYEDFINKAGKTGSSPKYFDYDGRKNPIDFYDYKIREDNLNKYITLIEESKSIDPSLYKRYFRWAQASSRECARFCWFKFEKTVFVSHWFNRAGLGAFFPFRLNE